MYIMALDQGTTSSRSIIFDSDGKMVSMAQKEFRQIFPKEGRVEHNPNDIIFSQFEVAREAIKKANISASQIHALGIANQRETTIVWDRKTGEPVYNAIVWQCRRTASECEKLKALGYENTVRMKTGLPIDAYFSATKIKWILDNVPGAREKANRGELCFGTVDTWLIWNLTNGRVHATDVTNASRTMLYNIHEMEWDAELLDIFDIPKTVLPEVLPSSGFFAETDKEILGESIPILGVAGDQQAALFGEACFKEGNVKNTYGTGCFMLMNTGKKSVSSENGLITTVAWQIGNEVTYALEGSVFVAGAVVQWLRDEMNFIASSPESENYAKSAEKSENIYMVPAFVGLGAPHWNSKVRGAIFGLTRGTGKEQIVRAGLESIAYQTHDVLMCMEKDSNIKIDRLLADGGASENNILMQFQADISNILVERLDFVETTAKGAVYLAGLAAGTWKNFDELSSKNKVIATFSPSMEQNERAKLISGWHKAVKAAMMFD